MGGGRRRWVCVAVATTSLLAIAGCGDGGSGTSGTESASATTAAVTDTTDTSAVAQTAPAEGCLPADQQPAAGTSPSFDGAEKVLKPGPATIVMTTSCGVLTIKLDRAAGGPIPNSVAFLAEKGFYDGLTFHRVVPDFVLQGGAPAGDENGGPGYEVVGPVPEGYRYKVGDVAMAKMGSDPAGTAGSQFFVISSSNGAAGLSQMPDYGILGHATDARSLKTISNIAALGVTDGPPSQPVWIISARVEQ